MAVQDPFDISSQPASELPPPPVELPPLPDEEAPAPSGTRFRRTTGSDARRLTVVEDFLESLSQDFQVVWLAYQNQERQKAQSSELIEYRCMGLKPDGQLCGAIAKAKRPAFRGPEEAVRCPHSGEWHQGGLTPMEPVLG